jgi:hypothetical protein
MRRASRRSTVGGNASQTELAVKACQLGRRIFGAKQGKKRRNALCIPHINNSGVHKFQRC